MKNKIISGVTGAAALLGIIFRVPRALFACSISIVALAFFIANKKRLREYVQTQNMLVGFLLTFVVYAAVYGLLLFAFVYVGIQISCIDVCTASSVWWGQPIF